ncbi:MAG: glycogen synthase, partial [Omnitrophica WOR_2 bacterium]
VEFGFSPASGSILPWWAQDLPLPLGLLTADHIVTVSPTYAREILTPEFGSGLQDFLILRKDSISGILNGIDTARWDPSVDSQLPVTFDSQQLPKRQTNKAILQKEFSLAPDLRIPLMGMITRMDYQKGIDLAINALRMLSDLPWQAILLGTGTRELEEAAQQLQAEFPDRVRAIIRFDPDLSRRIYGGADALLIPSRYEPCGLAQMIAMRYGCVPVARATGGLYDTIKDETLGKDATGFLFKDAVPEALAEAIGRAIRLYPDTYRWIELQQNGMSQDFSWLRSADEYLELYLSVVAKRGNYES